MTPAGSELEPLEVASGLVLGIDPEGELEGDAPETPLAALERAVLPALRRPPCLVSFSGGRDSSAVLALATNVARREGLPLPIPASNRFPDAPDSDESEWQDRLVRELGLDDWARLEHDGALDCIGPVATGVLERHGLLWPFNAHFHVPLFGLAGGGSLLTGIGGDEVFSPSSWSRANDVLNARVRPQPRDALRVGFALSPRWLRRRVLRRRVPVSYPWLRPGARHAFGEAWAGQGATEPFGWAAHVRWVRRLRYLRVGIASLGALAADDDVQLVNPLLDAELARALAGLPRRERFYDRAAGMRLVFGDLVPAEVAERTSKASFDAAFWNAHSRAFAARWDGEGVDHEIVDVGALKEEWRSDEPDPRSFTLVQSAWLARRAGSADGLQQTVDGIRQ
jgi:asparagine synthetase B (glutamine-hydrolysing)